MSVSRQFDRLLTLRDGLEDRLLLQESRHCFGNDDFEDGTASELKARIAELSDEIFTLGTGTWARA